MVATLGSGGGCWGLCPPGSLKKRDLFPAACEFTASLTVIFTRTICQRYGGFKLEGCAEADVRRKEHGKDRARCREDIDPSSLREPRAFKWTASRERSSGPPAASVQVDRSREPSVAGSL